MTSYTLDTCALIYIYERPNVGGLVACRFDSSKSNFYICSMNRIELERKGYDFYDVVIRVQQNIGAKIIVEDITPEIMDNAKILSCGCKDLHKGDREILSFAISKHSILVTSDKGLLKCCKKIGAKTVNLNGLATNYTKRPRAFYGRVSRYAKGITKERLWGHCLPVEGEIT